MTRVIHTGDTHIGYRQYHRPERRADFLAAFRRVVEDAVEDDVDAVVHAGDLFHDRRPDLQDILGTISALRTLSEASIPFLAVVGNHEAKRDAQWLDLFESLDLATRLDDRPYVLGDVALYGLDFVPRSQRDALEYDFAAHDADRAALVSHGLFQPFDYGDWDAGEVLRESSVEFDAMLLGDNHDPDRTTVEGAWVTYCGSTERASADERDERGYNIVTFEADGATGSDGDGDGDAPAGVSISRRGIPTREFVFVDVELAEGEGADRVRERAGQYDVEDAVVIVTVGGEGERIAPASVESHLDDRGALVARVTDRREFEEEDVEVTFADPDDAVRERVRELGLSSAARDIDETIRASKIADSNVADEVQERVRDLVEDPAAFDRADDPPGSAGAGTRGGDANAGAEAETMSDPSTGDGPEDASATATGEGSADRDPGPERESESGSELDAEPDAGADPEQSSVGDF